MAYIANFAAALETKTIPAKLLSNGTTYKFDTLRGQNKNGRDTEWTIFVQLRDANGEPARVEKAMLLPEADLPAGYYAVHYVRSRIADGKVRATVESPVREGKNLDKANRTNPLTQALRDAFGLYGKHMKHMSNGQAGPAAEPAAGPADMIAMIAVPAVAAPDWWDVAEADRAAAVQATPVNPRAMLVQKEGDSQSAYLTPTDFRQGVEVQRKYNGVRLNAYLVREGDRFVLHMYLRKGDPLSGKQYLRDQIAQVLRCAPPLYEALPEYARGLASFARAAYDVWGTGVPQVVLDGELYIHGRSLQYISGQARKESDEGHLTYVVFDCFFPAAIAVGENMPSGLRQKYLDAWTAQCDWAAVAPRLHRAERWRVRSMAGVQRYVDKFLGEKYEGVVARKMDGRYEYGNNNYHSPELLKFKQKHDQEYTVVDFKQGTKGKDIGAIIWIAAVDKTAAGQYSPELDPKAQEGIFSVTPKNMTYPQRKRLFVCMGEMVEPGVTRFAKYIKGAPLTVEYPELSEADIPVQAKAVAFRTYEDKEDTVNPVIQACLASDAQAQVGDDQVQTQTGTAE